MNPQSKSPQMRAFLLGETLSESAAFDTLQARRALILFKDEKVRVYGRVRLQAKQKK
ncbi:hypothetical protein IB213_11750 [Comamonas sp. CMM02]|nr:hypothetical protein [Comamonas sp. CMM02]